MSSTHCAICVAAAGTRSRARIRGIRSRAGAGRLMQARIALVSAYLQAAGHRRAARVILAITFTRKAAAE